MRFILASASPARLATLRAAGVQPEVIVSGVDEDEFTASTVAELVLALARAKATAVAGQMADADRQPGAAAIVLGCDSLLELASRADSGEPGAGLDTPSVGLDTPSVGLGKPGTAAEATARWRQLRGRTGILHTGHFVIDTATGRELGRVGSTEVDFAEISEAEIAAYVATGEPLGVAGGFTIDGLGGWYVDAVRGDHHNVVGLSLPLLRGLLGELGISISDLGSIPTE